MSSNPLVITPIDGEPRIDSRLVAVQLDVDHKNTRELIEKYSSQFEELGILRFETAKPPPGSLGGRPEKFYLLNEDQTYFLMTLARTTDQAVELKKRLVQAFSECRRQLQTGQPASSASRLAAFDALKLAKEGARVARIFGFTGNMVALSADCFAKRLTGISVLEYMGASHLLADERGRTYTATELGKLLASPVSAVKFNLLLEAAGLQIKEFGTWLPTDTAAGLFEWLDTGKRHSDGAPVKQIKWFKAVLERLVPGQKEAA